MILVPQSPQSITYTQFLSPSTKSPRDPQVQKVPKSLKYIKFPRTRLRQKVSKALKQQMMIFKFSRVANDFMMILCTIYLLLLCLVSSRLLFNRRERERERQRETERDRERQNEDFAKSRRSKSNTGSNSEEPNGMGRKLPKNKSCTPKYT